MNLRRTGLLVACGALLFGAGLLAGRLSSGSVTSGSSQILSAGSWIALALRPLHFPAMPSDGLCPQRKAQSISASRLTNVVSTRVRGEEPVYLLEPGPWAGITYRAELASPNRVFLFVSPQYKGQILVRGKRLNNGARLVFGEPVELRDPGTPPDPGRPAVPEAIQMEIQRVGTAQIDGHNVAAFSELRLPAGEGQPLQHPSLAPQLTGQGWRLFGWLQVPLDPGCYALQVDGQTFSAVLAVEVAGR